MEKGTLVAIRNCVLISMFFAVFVAATGHAQDLASVSVASLPPGTRILQGYTTVGGGYAPEAGVIPLDSFASVGSVNARQDGLRRELWRGVAMATALSTTLPNNGKKHHVNIAAGTAGGEQALSINYAALFGQVTFFAGAATAGNSSSLGKVGIGYSW
jgi:YadA-like protein